ncbi:MAG: hypothetical protein H0X02_07515 [Nitrosomonas sp.]|nr:hypothetical protein [Nitrosomonas sp.]
MDNAVDSAALSITFWGAVCDLHEETVITTIFMHQGVVYGGALRDIVAGQNINDLDIVVSVKYADSLHRYLTNLGYTPTPKPDNATILWTKIGHLPIESYVVEDDPATTCIGPEADPDFDVNLLRWDGKSVIRWTDCGDAASVVDAIRSKRATRIGENVQQHRIDKIVARGYSVV